MQGNKKYLLWCLNQSKGIRRVNPSQNLAKAYMQKSRTAMKSMEVNAKANIVEWAVSASYYAKYFAVYALFSRIGIKCEIHDCTIALFNFLFGDDVSSEVIQELKQSKKDRVEVQYYTREVKMDTAKLLSQTKFFVLEIEKIIDSLNLEKISFLQNRLKELMSELKSKDQDDTARVKLQVNPSGLAI